jgi:hypothetical protein
MHSLIGQSYVWGELLLITIGDLGYLFVICFWSVTETRTNADHSWGLSTGIFKFAVSISTEPFQVAPVVRFGGHTAICKEMIMNTALLILVASLTHNLSILSIPRVQFRPHHPHCAGYPEPF